MDVQPRGGPPKEPDKSTDWLAVNTGDPVRRDPVRCDPERRFPVTAQPLSATNHPQVQASVFSYSGVTRANDGR